MNNNEQNNVGPYRASPTNLNTSIGNPTININNAMNMNIQNNQPEPQNNIPPVVPNQSPVMPNPSQVVQNPQPQVVPTPSPQQAEVPQTSSSVTRTYISNNETKPQKKTVKLSFGPELKIAFLIVVILLIFIFLLPMISDYLH